MTSEPNVLERPVATPSTPGESYEEPGRAWSPALSIVVSALLLWVVGTFAVSHRAWPVAFVEDLWRWLRSPQIGAGWPVPEGLAVALPIAALVCAEGWLASRLLLDGSSLDGERSLALGLAIVLAISILGLGGLVCVVAQHLARPELLVFYLATGVLLVLAWRRKRGALVPRKHAPASSVGAPRVLRRITAAVAAIVVVFSLVRATLTPVTEWDATIYHAETARMWFVERPDPPLRYGPSIGIEISSNYPPLFPAAGAATYTLVGASDDLYLRVLPPILLAALLLMLFGYARRRFGPVTANLAVLLVAGSPLTLAYGVWTTGYMLLAALILACVILVDLAADSDRRAPWIGAGVVAGLAILSHFYGLLALVAPVSALATRRPRRWTGALIFVAAAMVVASPWLLRNLLRMGDPFYPLGAPLFTGKGLVDPIWRASQNGIKSKALGYWGGAAGPGLTVRQLATSLFDRQLLIAGGYFGLWFGLVSWRRRPRATYLAAFFAGAIVALLAPGWYWLRALVPIVSVGALLTANLISWILASTKMNQSGQRKLLARPARAAVFAVVAAVVLASGTVGTSLAVAGPDQRLMTARPGDDVLDGVRILGSSRVQLWDAFGGDLLMWDWLDLHLLAGERFATLEIRTYYLDRPEAAFYLDGVEAVPLLNLSDPKAARRFLQAHGIRFVVIPSWAAKDPTGQNIAGLMPLFRFLGSRWFPAVAAFPVGRSEHPSVVYSVGPTDENARLGLATASQPRVPAVDEMSATFPDADAGNRIFVPTPLPRPAALRFEYDADVGARFGLTLLSPAGSWDVRHVGASAAAPGWRMALVPLPPSPSSPLDLGVFVHGADLIIRDAQVVYPAGPIVQAPRRLLQGAGAVHRLVPGGGGRIYVPVAAGLAVLRFEYLARPTVRLRALVRGDGGGWIVRGATKLTGSGEWTPGAVRVRASEPGFVEVWLRPSSSSVLLRRIGTD